MHETVGVVATCWGRYHVMRRHARRARVRVPPGGVVDDDVFVDAPLPPEGVPPLVAHPQRHGALQVQVHRHRALASVQRLVANPYNMQNDEIEAIRMEF